MKLSRIVMVLAAAGLSARADEAVLNFSVAYSGPNPAAPAPWLRATLTDTLFSGSPSVFLRVEAIGLSNDEFVSTWGFNVRDAITPSSLRFTEVFRSGYTGSSTPQAGSQNGINAGGGFRLDFDLNLPTTSDSRFGVGDVLTYRIDRTGGLNIYDLLVTTTGTATSTPMYGVAHIQALAGGNSVWVGSSSLNPIPEPSTYAAGIAVAAMVGVGVLRRRSAKA